MKPLLAERAAARWWDMVEWTIPQYSRGEVKRAGRVLAADKPRIREYLEALEIVNNWRSAHSYPLQTVLMLLRGNTHKVDNGADVVRRMKRLRSIRLKLERTSLDLTQIQDLGGCRSVVKRVKDVDEVVARLEKSRTKHDLYDHDDYISTPKASGYRSYHLMFKCRSDAYPEFDGLRIEIQVRSRPQHSWATAVETVGLFQAQDLKASEGDKRWLRFFALMGSELARRENTATVPNTPSTVDGLRSELRDLATELDVVKRLEAYGSALQQVTQAPSGASIFLLILDAPKEELSVVGYGQAAQAHAQAAYQQAEAENAKNPGIDVVLVAADSIDALRRAYPNYFADTTAFRAMVERAIE